MTRKANPIRVRAVHLSIRHRDAWMWDCVDHPRHRGYHHRNRRKDFILARMGKPPDTSPYERALAAAIKHWHRYHDPAGPCTCCDHAKPRREA